MSTKRPRAARTRAPQRTAPHGATPATIVSVSSGGERALVRFADGDRTSAFDARVARLPGYLPTAGDRVLVAGDPTDLWVIGIVRAAAPLTLDGAMRLPDGGSVALAGGGVELRDGAGRLVVRYVDGAATVEAPSGDLVLGAPSGRVVLRSGLDVSIEAARDVVHRAGRSVAFGVGEGETAPRIAMDPRTIDVRSERVTVEADKGSVTLGELSTVARAIATKATTVAVTAERYELSATRLVEKARDAFRDVSDLAQSRLGRVRTLVAGAYSQRARRTVIVSQDDTSIDGRKIHLG